MKINFNEAYTTNKEIKFISQLLNKKKFESNGEFTKKASVFLERKFKVKKVLITHSCTGALEMSALAIDLKKNEEVLVPSYTFPTTASAFIRAGAKIKFIDIELDTLCIDINKIKKNITKKTKAVVIVNYAGVSGNLLSLKKYLNKRNIYLIEDNAQGLNSKIKDRYLGTIGDLGCISFHVTKNIHCGSGGALFINNKKFINKSIQIWDKGTNRIFYNKKKLKNYEWTVLGSNFYPSELQSAFLLDQIYSIEKNTSYRKKLFYIYKKNLENKIFQKYFKIIKIPKYNKCNYHAFYILFKNKKFKEQIVLFLKKNNIFAHTHYYPLHMSKFGKKIHGKKKLLNTEIVSDCLLRLPLHNNLNISNVKMICNKIMNFYSND